VSRAGSAAGALMSEPVRELARLLREMHPRLHEQRTVFCALPAGASAPDEAIAWFREAEGVSVVLPADVARTLGHRDEDAMAWITLEVHSALDAVGLTAAVSAALAAEGIPCNIIAALRHDHLFVPVARAADALAALERLSADASPTRS
jgi:hypothetical protein